MLKILVNKDKCTLCGCCVDACPVGCLRFTEDGTRVEAVREDLCLVCRNCEDEAPKIGCIRVDFPF